MLFSIRRYVLIFLITLATFSTVLAQAVVTIDQQKDACNGLFNGSIRLTVTSGVENLSYFMIGINFSQSASGNLDVGVPVIVPNLRPDNYILIVDDGDPGPNFNTSLVIGAVSGVTASVNAGFPVHNSSCVTPNGQISVTASGGSGSYTYLWDGPGSYTATTDDITGLAGGAYQLTVTDQGTNCIFTLTPVIVNDPSPILYNIVPPLAKTVCTGSNLLIDLSGSELGVSYEVIKNGNPTGIILIGTGALLSFVVPSGTFATGDVYSIIGTNGFCTPSTMNGIVNVTVAPLPTISGVVVGSVCAGSTSTNLNYTTTTGSPNQYSIDFDATAEAQGFVDVVNVALPASPVPITVPALAVAGNYNATLTVRNSTTGCPSTGIPITITIISNPTITLGANPSVCIGSVTANLPYSATTGSPNQYSINFNPAAEAQGFVDVVNVALPASPIVITVPGAAIANTYNATLTVRNTGSTCSSSSQPITVTINPNPTITLGANPSVCSGSTTANLGYSATTGSPNQYSINFNAAAEGQGFVDVVNAALPATPIVITVPGLAVAGAYNATLSVRSSATGCVSGNTAISVTIVASPTITLGPNPSVCLGSATANLGYTGTTGGPNQYSINFDAAAEGQGFIDVVNVVLPASPIVITIPGAAVAGTYNGTLSVLNTVTGCSSASQAISVTINPTPTITLGPNPSVCTGSTTAALPYSATTGTPNQYSINFNPAAEAQGFADVVNAALPATPISITVPGAAIAGTYNATITVRNSVTGCVSVSSPISVTIVGSPTITLGPNPSVCIGSPTANLGYSATTGGPNQYSINFNAAAEAQGFIDVVNAALPATPIVITIPGAAVAGTYNATLSVRNSATGCVSGNTSISVTIVASPTITLGPNPSVCIGSATANLGYTGTTGGPNQYSIDFNPAAEGQGFVDIVNAALPASPIVITIPGAAVAGTYNGTLTVRNTVTGCSGASQPISVTINPTPTITLGPNPSVCTGSTTAALAYSATTGTPNQYSINFNAAAEAQGFVDVVNAALPVTPISITVPGAAIAGTYNATITVRNSATGCVSAGSPISVTIIGSPTITLGANPSVCIGSPTANLGYSATTGSPDQYSINFNAAAEAQGFVDVVNAVLPATPIVITVPGAAVAGTYNGTLTVRNSATSCVSGSSPISVTIVGSPTITLGPNPSVCIGSPTANLGYTATTGSPNQYSIDFNAAAEAQGFVDVVNVVLPASPIVITIPGAAVAGTYSGTLTVRNTVTGCGSTSQPVSVTINPTPTITLGPNPSVCTGSITAALAYSATTGTPNQYSINYNAAAEAQGFVDVVNAALPATPISLTVPGAAVAGTYNATLTVRSSATGCVSVSSPISVTIAGSPTITLGANPSVCIGTATANLGYSATTGSPDQYSINFNAAAEAQGFVDIVNAALPATPIVITVPGAAVAGTYNGTLTARNSVTGCASASQPISVTIVSTPTITLSANPSVCVGSPAANLGYTATTGTPNQYSIDFNAAAEAQGFVDVVNAALPATPIVITIPGPAVAGTYNGTLTVRNAVTGCSSTSQPVSVTINSTPTITLGPNPTVCIGSLTAALAYSATTGTPNQYNINFDAAAEAQGFVDVVNAALPATPISITVPGAAVAGTYNATITVRIGASSCSSTSQPIAITISPISTISGIVVGSICAGSTSTNLNYTTTTGSPNQYSIDFDATAEAQGFVDVVNNVLPTSPISITIPASAISGDYNANFTVTNSLTGCPSTSVPITITILPNPSITLGANPLVCTGSPTANLNYTATTGSPNQYSINFNPAAEAQGFVDVVNAALPASPIVITIPGAAVVGTYNATLTVRSTSSTCSSPSQPISVTINTSPTITLGANPTVCAGSANASLAYSATTGSPDRFSIDFNAAAEAQGFVDVTNIALPASPISITVPVSAVAGTYSATLMVSNTVTGCTSPSQAIAVTLTPSPTAVISGTTAICNGSSTNITINFTGTGPWSFQYSDGTTTSPAIPSFFNSISFSVSPTATTTYTLVSVSDNTVCPGTVNGSAVVTVNQNPQVNSPVGVTINPVCSGGTTDVTLNSEVGVSYQLRNNTGNVLVGTPVIGTGGTISLPTGPLVANQTFNVLATATGCASAQLTNLANVAVTGTINAGLSVTALANPICEGTATIIQVINSENGVLYQLRDDSNNSLVGGTVAGTGLTIDLPTGNLANTTTFNVLASNGSCSIELTDIETVNVNVNPDPALAVAVTLDPICVGGSSAITVALSEIGVNYQLRTEPGDVNVGAVVAGTGGTISLPTGVLNATTTFNVLAVSGVCPAVELTTLATVNVSGVAVDATLAVTSAASPICAGTSTNIQVANSEIGVSYQLRDNADNSTIGAAVAGTGASINLPTGNLAVTTTFNVLASSGSCSIQLTDTETVTVDPAPNAGLTVAVTLNPLCTGGTSAITVALSQTGVSYQLRNDAGDVNIGLPVPGTGGTISLSTGVLNATSTFNVLASSGVCSSTELTQLATVNVTGSLNAALNVTSSASPICAGTSTFIQVGLSEAGVNYQLRNDANDSNIGAAIVGNGATINLPTGNLAASSTFNVVASNGTCSIELTDTETVAVNPAPNIALAVAPASGLICSGTSTNIVVTASELGVSYQLRNNTGNVAVGPAVVGTGNNISLPTGNLTVNTTFNVLATVGTCSVQLTATASVAIRPIGDPACGPGGSDCTNFSSIQPTIVAQPSCNDRDAGEVSFTISRSDSSPTTFRVIWSYNGTDQTKFTSNTVSFDDLNSGLYQYTIIDEGNGKSCGPVDFFLDLKTQVEILDKEVLSSVNCFGGTDGNVKLTVDGTTTGEYWYRYVLDGQESVAQTFTPGAPLPGGLPADDDDFIIIKVDEDFAFACPDTVMVRIKHAFPKIDFAVTSTEVTTCNGTDGAIRVSGITGGNTTTSGLQIRLKKEVPLSTDPSGYVVLVDFQNVNATFDFTSLSQGNYIVDVKDQIDCIQSKPIAIQAPGQVPLSLIDIVATDATCVNEGASGSIQVTINQAGIYEVAVSQDQVNIPSDDQFVAYNSPSLPNVTFNNLIRGRYFLYMKSNTTLCPTRSDVIPIGGVYAISDFDIISNCENVNITLNNIAGQQDAPFVVRVFSNDDKFFKIDSLTASSIPLSNSVSFIYTALQHSFLVEPGTYRFVMVQNQTTGAGTCTLVSDTVVYDIRQQIGIVLGQVKPSFPDPKRTGSIEIENILGGTRFVSGTNELYYEVSLVTADDDIVVFDWAQAKLNPQNKFAVLFDYISPGVYRVKVRDASGCIKTQDIEISLDPSVYVPNIFTPNDDAVNDEFEILNLPLEGKHKLIISNRWGNEVFTSKDYRQETFWNAEGTSDGIYFYRLQIEGGETFTGWVEILRGTKP